MSTNTHISPSLSVLYQGKEIFTHTGKWLHPLFALEEYLGEHEYPAGELELRDRIIGKAAGLLVYRLGIRLVHGRLMSDLAAEYLDSQGVTISWDQRVSRIECRTEELFAETNDHEAAYIELRRRAGLS